MSITKRGWAFLGLAFGIAWGLGGMAWFAGIRAGSPVFLAMESIFMLAPLAAALIVSALRPDGVPLKESLAFRFRMGWKSFFLAWLLFPAVSFLALGLSLLLPGVAYDPSMSLVIQRAIRGLSPDKAEEVMRTARAAPPLVLMLAQGLAAGLSINAVFGFGEEAGWRGFLVKELKGSSFWGASLFTGAVWGLWHAPLVIQGHNYPEHPVAGVFLMIVWCVLLSPIFLYIRLRSRSAVAAAIAHGTLNATAGLPILLLTGGSDLTVGVTGLAGFVVLAFVIVVIRMIDGRSTAPVLAARIGAEG